MAATLGAPEFGQFYDDGFFSTSHEACLLTCLKMAGILFGTMQGVTLNQLIGESPLADGWNGLPCEWGAAVGFKHQLDCRLETMNIEKIKAHIDQKHAVICLLKYSDIPRKLVQDVRFSGFHFELANGYDDNGNFLMNDPDRTSINSNWGLNIPVPMAIIDKALADSDQTRLCVVVYGKLEMEAQYAGYINIQGGANLRAYAGTDHVKLTVIPHLAPIYVLNDAPVTINGDQWLRVQTGNNWAGWVFANYITNGSIPLNQPLIVPDSGVAEFWKSLLTYPPSTQVKFTVAGKDYIIAVSDMVKTVTVESGSWLNVRSAPTTSAKVVGRLNKGDKLVVPQPRNVTGGFVQTAAPPPGWVSAQWIT